MKMLSLLLAALALMGCGSDPYKPNNQAEMYPINCGTPSERVVREKGPLGLIINTGTAPAQVCLYDRGGRLEEVWYLDGANQFILSPNTNLPYPQALKRPLDPGCHDAHIYHFYKAPPLLLRPGPVFVFLPMQSQRICTTNSDTTHLIGGEFANWVMRMGANIPVGRQSGAAVPNFRGMIQLKLPFD